MSVVDFAFGGAPYIAGTGFHFRDQTVYASAPIPAVSCQIDCRWEKGATAGHQSVMHWNEGTRQDHQKQAPWELAEVLQSDNLSPWDQVSWKDTHARKGWQEETASNAQPHLLVWGNETIKDGAPAHSRWDHSIRALFGATGFHYLNRIPLKDSLRSTGWHSVALYGLAPPTAPGNLPAYLPNQQPLNFLFAGQDLYSFNYTPEVFFHFSGDQPEKQAQTRDTRCSSRWNGTPSRRQGYYKLPWGFGRSAYALDPYIGIKYPDYDGPITPPGEPEAPEDKPSYLIMNTVQINELAGGTPLLAENIKISVDIDSFVWTFSGDLLNQASLSLVAPDGVSAKEIEVIINGYRWVFMIERYNMRAQFPAQTYQISGVSRTQYLALPYAPKQTKTYTAALQASQIVHEELSAIGFTANWEPLLPDWTIGANVYSYVAKTPMEVVSEIVNSVGAIAIAVPDQNQFEIKRRYKALPWQWDAQPLAAVDNIVSESMVLSFSLEWQPSQAYNAVYVSGIHTGRAVNVVRSSTAGDRPAEDVVGVLYLDEQQIAEKARAIMSDSGNQSVITVQVPLPPGLGSPGLLIPGNLVEYRNAQGAAQFRALCLSNAISISGVGAAEVTQTVKLERHY
jgi:hypothetical protein